jgi:hypothetical protein
VSHHSSTDFEENPFLAAKDLGVLLWEGSLRLFLGAGVSKGFGLPEWRLLIAKVLGKDQDRDYVRRLSSRSVQDLREEVDALDSNDEEFRRKVHHALYSEVKDDLLPQLQVSPLLLAVAGLMTGVTRGRVDSVFTFNYDDLLEQYLRMLGLSVCVRTLPTDLSIRSDLELNYVHGRVPQGEAMAVSPARIVLSEKSYRERRAEIDAGWSDYIVHGLYSKIGLFLGLSGDDEAIKDVLKRAQGRIKRTSDFYTGYWVLTPTSFTKNRSSILDVGMCPIPMEKDQIPQFIFAVCQSAMG